MRAVTVLFVAPLAMALAACQPTPAAAPPAAGDDTPVPKAAASSEHVVFQCGELAVEATYHGQERATVRVAGRTLQLEPEMVASGARFGDAQGNALWTKGDGDGVLSLAGEPDRTCRAGGKDSSARTIAPARFHARGNEPGWTADVEAGIHGGPVLRVEVDYGDRRFEVPTPAQGADGWIGKATDGTDIKLSFQRGACEDDMSGEPFEARAMLTVGTRQYHGCGTFAAR
ncbi:MliC family protein [Stenotrophomonas sp. 24(2023)]|uniref:MliC family protein n=1 Tax=Stenotrophomonas sp. 24(2023) TaxID=3068324 RepID=UPI0027E0BCCB|nr:MliC family protein [Stenotrophomonas sp. 24(2023)]WMJ69032.1 MliC family protein [Stenotrophomonas sp. 24(2023)]